MSSPNRQCISPHVLSKSPNTLPQISKIFRRSASSILSFLFSSEKTQPPISPYTCHRPRALCYGWSAVVPWSCLFFLHVHGLCARRYRLWAIRGRELRAEFIARSPFMPSTVISITAKQHTFRSFLYEEDLVSDLSLHMLRAPRSVLWVVGYGSLVTPFPPTRARAPRSTSWTMG